MHTGAHRALEFDRVVDALRSFVQTPLGDRRVRELQPQTDPREVAQALAATSEGVRYLAETRPSLLAADDLESVLDALAMADRALEPTGLRTLAAFLASTAEVEAAIRQLPSAEAPALHRIADRTCSFADESRAVARAIDDNGDVTDDASPALRAIRARLRTQRDRLRGTLESFFRGKETSRYLQDRVVTDRNGRYVLVVRSEHRTAIPGLVHGQSASGASLYVEPLNTVELNNDVIALIDDERIEIHRILLALTDAFRARAGELQRTLDAAAEFDMVYAKARLAQLVGGIAPDLSSVGQLELRDARHPLLMRGVTERLNAEVEVELDRASADQAAVPRATEPVPIDLLLTPPVTTLVVTGPNTGGKTVALKTAGLLALMTQTGLHIPVAKGSRLPVFRSIFADIGDDQSIAASLSTFSGHIAKIVAMDRELADPALVLLDEVGAGTDPVEGGALGTAIVEHFRQRGARVIVTSHDDALKSFAATTDGVSCAAFGFDPDTFAPTYALRYGSPGRSLALEIAGRLGLPAQVVEAARRYRGGREARLADHLARVEDDRQSLDRDRHALNRERSRLETAGRALVQREAEIEARTAAMRQRERDRIDRRVQEAKRQVDAVVADLKRRGEALLQEAGPGRPRLSTGRQGDLRRQARETLAEVAEQSGVASAVTSRVARSTKSPAPGDLVEVSGLGIRGRVRSLDGSLAELEAQGKRLQVEVNALAVLEDADRLGPAKVEVAVQLGSTDEVGSELNVIGCRVDEAVARVEKFLDGALLAERRTVRVIHGQGTGQLRRAIAELLDGHVLVDRVATPPPEEGGRGVTVVELRA
ncbi:MAG: Smr/MutS family protein [Vicinamibacterales bacterium]|jgi:DNA mismatch repair protein MutS2|nr:hypothetical protein [Acidobacteriota bacterium]MDP6372445.1 Smr/MutS family protein [Vicinamibacterales bacterium]MDP6608932.1 Smr/MutS family protein [Vicinamibacterales bacterium]HAK54284.1 hypothetical protein [Acidobacteriota bacterium]